MQIVADSRRAAEKNTFTQARPAWWSYLFRIMREIKARSALQCTAVRFMEVKEALLRGCRGKPPRFSLKLFDHRPGDSVLR